MYVFALENHAALVDEIFAWPSHLFSFFAKPSLINQFL
jgi:hypothetical protein